MSHSPKYRPSPNVLSRTIGTETILFDLQSSSYYSLNEVGGRFWRLVQDELGTEQILSTLIGEFDVERPALEADIISLVDRLQELGLLQPAVEGA
jgi:hypothetical protein